LKPFIIMYRKIRVRKDFENIDEAYRWARHNLGIDKYEVKNLMIIGGKRAWEER
jgi:hypothetical protein